MKFFLCVVLVIVMDLQLGAKNISNIILYFQVSLSIPGQSCCRLDLNK